MVLANSGHINGVIGDFSKAKDNILSSKAVQRVS